MLENWKLRILSSQYLISSSMYKFNFMRKIWSSYYLSDKFGYQGTFISSLGLSTSLARSLASLLCFLRYLHTSRNLWMLWFYHIIECSISTLSPSPSLYQIKTQSNRFVQKFNAKNFLKFPSFPHRHDVNKWRNMSMKLIWWHRSSLKWILTIPKTILYWTWTDPKTTILLRVGLMLMLWWVEFVSITDAHLLAMSGACQLKSHKFTFNRLIKLELQRHHHLLHHPHRLVEKVLKMPHVIHTKLIIIHIKITPSRNRRQNLRVKRSNVKSWNLLL